MRLLHVSGIVKNGKEHIVLNRIEFSLNPSQKLAICGETGSGKSTLLKIIGGLIQPDGGEVWLENTRVKGPDDQLIPGHPKIAYLSQQYELRNHYRVEELLEMANKLSHNEAEAIYEICRISHLVKRRTNELSGGEKQRIALARLLITKPSLLLLDEPFSNLDLIHKTILKKVLESIGKELGITCILASHDPADVLSWADELIVLKDGTIVQQAAPVQAYHQPVNEYVAGLLGRYNLLPDHLARLFDLPLGNTLQNKWMVRPEGFILHTAGTSNNTTGIVINARFMGAFYEVDIFVQGVTITVFSDHPDWIAGTNSALSLKPGAAVLLPFA